MSAEVTLKDLLIELKGQRADDKRSNRMALRSARAGVGKMTTRGVLAEAMFDRLEIGKTIGRAASVMSLGLKRLAVARHGLILLGNFKMCPWLQDCTLINLIWSI